ncbi:A-factor biosynthesis hotdog domain protein (plasmid) [Streptomyces sp. YIM 121038]|uniref:AfsA-related hotdog domain-containing protein n=1 Tax=Streptomyces sp. YIM 121038 TaxID=2136401 RepID=UPI0011108D49|nr:AfsA-related hotdog domain-containing protein [Streptomyces sp. YIM 121038]QCX82942.1 A-factor biosynthesis hotdog domain protein [Streptomyces sp. YIM 121038]
MHEDSSALFLVGDRFSGFAGQQVRPVSQFRRELEEGRYDSDGKELRLLCGQGIDEPTWHAIRAEIHARGLEARLAPGMAPPLACQPEVNKLREPNVLIADLALTGGEGFCAALRVHNDNELLLDHPSDHVQGIVLAEAMRQMARAVGARYIDVPWPKPESYFVMDCLNIMFSSFLYPLPAIITAHRTGLRQGSSVRYQLHLTIRQAGRTAAEGDVDGTIFPQRSMQSAERYLASQTVRQLLLPHD